MSSIPHDSQPINGGGAVSRPWRAYLQSLEARGDASAREMIEQIARKLGSPDGKVANIPEQESGDLSLIGLRSIQVIGPDEGGEYRIALRGDASFPANNAFYGMGPDAEPGFHLVADALAADEGIAKTVDAEGVTTFALEDIAPIDGGAIQRTQFDGKGRRTHEATATTTHLPEGDNLYFTEERARDAAGGFVPTFTNSIFTVPVNTQALFVLPIELGAEGGLVIDGALVEVSQ